MTPRSTGSLEEVGGKMIQIIYRVKAFTLKAVHLVRSMETLEYNDQDVA